MGYKELWWIKPSRFTIFFLIPLYCLIHYTYRMSPKIGKTVNYFLDGNFFLGLLLLLLLALGSLIGESKKTLKESKNIYYYTMSIKYLDFLFVMTLFAYILWFGKLLLNPQIILQLLKGTKSTMYFIRNNYPTIPGITTFTQLGVVYSIFYVLSKLNIIYVKKNKRIDFYFIIIIIFTLFRIIAWSERLAFIELILPISIIFIQYKSNLTKIWIKFIPFLGVVGLYIYFGIFEYFRSWVNYYNNIYDSYFQFVSERVTSYYTTALNNGAGLFEVYGTTTGLPNLLKSFYEIPIIKDILYYALRPISNTFNFLNIYADLEFNNVAGLFLIPIDLGLIGSLVFVFILGLFGGILYTSFILKKGIGVVIYPIYFLGLVEIFRILYITETRTFYILIFLFIGYFFFLKRVYVNRNKSNILRR